MKLVIVEDSEVVQAQLLRAISEIPLVTVVGAAASEERAVQLILNVLPDVVLLDLGLLEGSGLGVLRRLRGAGSAVRVLVLTNNVDWQIREACEAHGIDGFFDKSQDFQACLAKLSDGVAVAGSAVADAAPIADSATARPVDENLAQPSPAPASAKDELAPDRAARETRHTVAAHAPGARNAGAIDVCITVDLEFDINFAFRDPERQRPIGAQSVFRPVGGRSEGLGFMLDTLARDNLPATFFTEVLSTTYFGVEELRNVARLIVAKGHDAQLHAHPCWRTFAKRDWATRIRREPPNDSWAGMGDAAVPLLNKAKEIFRDVFGHDPNAFRPGNMLIDRKTYDALHACGIPASSSIGLGYFKPDDEALHRFVTPMDVAGVLEAPVATFWERTLRGRRPKLLTITGTNWDTMRSFLEWAHSFGIGPVIILTHASEFADMVGHLPGAGIYRRNSLNQERFATLSRFLDANRGRFNTTTFSASHANWSPTPDMQYTAPILSPVTRLFERTLAA